MNEHAEVVEPSDYAVAHASITERFLAERVVADLPRMHRLPEATRLARVALEALSISGFDVLRSADV